MPTSSASRAGPGCGLSGYEDEREAIDRHVDEYDRLTEAQKGVERDIARTALGDANVKRLMTIPGCDMVVSVGVLAAIGRIDRFSDPDKLVAYFGLNPSVELDAIHLHLHPGIRLEADQWIRRLDWPQAGNEVANTG